MIDAVRNRLPDLDGSRQVGQARANVGPNLVHASRQLGGRFQADIEFAHMHALGMFVQFGAATTPPDVRDLGHLAHQHLGLARHRGAFG